MEPVPEFVAFGPAHIGALAGVAVVAAGLPWLAKRRLDLRSQLRLAPIIAAGLLLHEIGKIAMRSLVYDVPLTESLPLHLCNLAALMTIWVLWKRSYPVYEIAYFWGIGGSLPALLTPDLAHGFPHPLFFIFFSGHGLIILGVLYATLVYGFRPRWHSIGKTIAASLALIAVMIPINVLLDTNYLYIFDKPAQATLIDYLGPWPWYVPAMFAIGVGLCLACYAPFAIIGRPATAGGRI